MAEKADIKRTDEAAGPVRTCVGCRAADGADRLLRFSVAPSAQAGEVQIVPDPKGKLGGRGLWLCPSVACFRQACKHGFSRALKRPVKVDVGRLADLAVSQLERRAAGLLSVALRRREAVFGSDLVSAWLDQSPAAGAGGLLVVAKDAAGRRGELIRRADQSGLRWVELRDKAWLGSLAARGEVAFVAVMNAQIAEELASTADWIVPLLSIRTREASPVPEDG